MSSYTGAGCCFCCCLRPIVRVYNFWHLGFFFTAQQCTAAPTSAATMNEVAQEITTEMAILVEHDVVAVSESVLPVEQQ